MDNLVGDCRKATAGEPNEVTIVFMFWALTLVNSPFHPLRSKVMALGGQLDIISESCRQRKLLTAAVSGHNDETSRWQTRDCDTIEMLRR